jgi:hypothetical protein
LSRVRDSRTVRDREEVSEGTGHMLVRGLAQLIIRLDEVPGGAVGSTGLLKVSMED